MEDTLKNKRSCCSASEDRNQNVVKLGKPSGGISEGLGFQDSSSKKLDGSSPSPVDLTILKTTGRRLRCVLKHWRTKTRPLSTFQEAVCFIHHVDCDEVYPSIYIGDMASATNKMLLKKMGITHILNAAEGSYYGQVDTSHAYYRGMPNIHYMGFPMTDRRSTNISRHFYKASDFIENGVDSGGKVLVHCMAGVSRSATCVLTYLMIKKKMSAIDAIRTVRLRREIRPNYGFLKQLAVLDNKLRSET